MGKVKKSKSNKKNGEKSLKKSMAPNPIVSENYGPIRKGRKRRHGAAIKKRPFKQPEVKSRFDTQTKKKALQSIKKLSKKEKRRRSRKVWIQHFLLPGDPEKFQKNSLSSSLSDALVDVANDNSVQNRGCKSKNKHWRRFIAPAALSQFSSVLQHPAFQKNPFDAIKQHLTNTNERQEAL